ncbi:odorant receptor Or1-like [Vanessa atalanta]|uniref:odorant receptor Or1-like n=1 Tax=Vanessa atalanta TaxID=42275 RepID=UPI001FCD5000|nr:odorant receptor Or1-like [Vanessa atalanta]
MFILGIYIIVQVGDLIQVWGNLPLMTATIFLLFTNIALGTKLLNVMWRKDTIRAMLEETNDELCNESRQTGKEIVRSCDRETTKQLSVYFVLSYTTVLGWASSAEKNQLPLRAWYPYDTSKTPTYQLTYAHQTIAVSLAAAINICLDTLVTSLICQCRCRLRLLALSLRTLCHDLDVSEKGAMTDASSTIVSERLQNCVVRHQTVLAQTKLLQNCFSASIFAQFCVSMIIICVTAYQLAFVRESTSLARVISMVAYLTVMMLQVFLYCYQGNQLVEESEGVSGAAYECPWYILNIPIRRSLLLVMTRTRRAARLTAAGFTELSLSSFMSIIKASYTFFTVLQQIEED